MQKELGVTRRLVPAKVVPTIDMNKGFKRELNNAYEGKQASFAN